MEILLIELTVNPRLEGTRFFWVKFEKMGSRGRAWVCK